MAHRAEKSGLSREAQRKMQAKYDNGLEEQIRGFFFEQMGEHLEPRDLGPQHFHKALKDGVKLCELMNKLKPGSVKKINKTTMAFKQMENVSNFNDALRAYGVDAASTFQTSDLYDNQDMATVQNSLWQLILFFRKSGGKTEYGIKMSEENKREFDEDTLKQGQSVIGLQMGTNKGASQAGMVAMGTQRKL